MKKLLWILVVVCLLGGCHDQKTPETLPAIQAQSLPPETTKETLVDLPPETTLETFVDLPMQTVPERLDTDFVRVCDYLPNVHQALMYATDKNFTGQVIYEFEDAWLRYGTVTKLMAVSADLEELGLYLKIWDGFRPVSAQFVLWEVCPNPTYVANPNVGFSSHSRGNTVDVTLVDEQGKELEMPTAFDDFSAMADRNYADCSPEAASNAQILELLMEKHGFSGYAGEWWHFSDTDSYPVEQEFDPGKEK